MFYEMYVHMSANVILLDVAECAILMWLLCFSVLAFAAHRISWKPADY
jgi:hypothetical protein